MGSTYSKIKRSAVRSENALHRAAQDGDVVAVRRLTLTDEHVRKMSDRAPVPFTWHDWTDAGRALALGREPEGLNTPLHLAMQGGISLMRSKQNAQVNLAMPPRNVVIGRTS